MRTVGGGYSRVPLATETPMRVLNSNRSLFPFVTMKCHLCFHSASSKLPSFLLNLRFKLRAGTMWGLVWLTRK